MKETKYQIEIIIRLKDSYVKTYTRSKGINAVGLVYFVSGHDIGCMILTYLWKSINDYEITIDNHMISSAIWNRKAGVNLFKDHKWLIHSKLHEKNN